jgi:hypothetical protein
MLANLNSPRNSLPRYTANEDGSLISAIIPSRPVTAQKSDLSCFGPFLSPGQSGSLRQTHLLRRRSVAPVFVNDNDGKAGLQPQPITLCSGGEDDPAPSRFLRTRDGSMILICRSWCRGRPLCRLIRLSPSRRRFLSAEKVCSMAAPAMPSTPFSTACSSALD